MRSTLDVSTISNQYIPCSTFSPSQEAFLTTEFEKTVPCKTFSYKINEYGFRYDTTPKKKTICFVGCSITFGVGLAQDQIFPELVTRQLGDDWQCINLGVPGSGPDIQMNNLNWALNNFKIDKVVWYMSDPMRQAFWKNHLHLVVPSFANDRKDDQKFMNHLVEFEDNTLMKTYWNLYSTFSLLKEKNVDTYFRCWIGEYHSILLPLIREFNIKDFGNMKNMDKARDDMHHGPLSHEQFSKHLLGKINEI